MKYELYVIRDKKRYIVDLNEPSGITLKFKSTLFGDITKITASHSYSFSIPQTERNKLVFDSIEDMRHTSAMFGTKIPAELYLDGVPLFTRGYLYIDSLEDTYSAVLTWDICTGLETIKDNDMSIRELTSLEGLALQRWEGADANFNNLATVSPAYTTQDYWTDGVITRQFYNPCMPIYKVLKAIENHYHITIKLGEEKNTSDLIDIPEVLTPEFITSYGVLPFVSRIANATIKAATNEIEGLVATMEQVSDLTEVFDQDAKGRDKALFWDDDDDEWNKGRHLFQISNSPTEIQNEWYSVSQYKITSRKNCRLRVRFRTNIYHGSENINTQYGHEYESLTIWCYRYRPRRKMQNRDAYYPEYYEKIDEFSGSVEKTWNEQYSVVFINQIHNVSIECDDFLENDELFFVFAQTRTFPQFTVEEPFTVTIDPHPSQQSNYYVDICPNLPDITCLNLVKSLYFAIGGFPRINKEGEMELVRYTDVLDNIKNGKAYNWSNKLLKGLDDPDTLALSYDGMAQKSYLLMANEEEEGEKSNEEDGAWESPRFSIDCESKILERTSTIYKFPFYGRFITNRIVNQYLDTYETYEYRLAKAEENKDYHWASHIHPEDRYLFKETDGKPALGLIGKGMNSGLSMVTWSTRMINGQYVFLQDMMRKPYVLKERMTLSVVDLMNLDYSRPVYISRYNSYFAIISVEVGSDGISNVELIRIVT